MGWFDWLWGPSDKKSASSSFDRLLIEYLGGNSTLSGESVNPTTAMQCADVYACVNVISESLAQLPLLTYRRLNGRGKERATNHPLYLLLKNTPNSWQTSFEFRQMLTAHILLRGNAYAYKNVVGGRLRELIPIHPDICTFEQKDDYSIEYKVTTKKGQATFDQSEIFHIRGLSLDGVTGVSPITFARESIGLDMAVEKHGATLFGNGARPSGFLVSPTPLKDDDVMLLKTRWQEANGGRNQNKIAVLHGGLDFKTTSISPNDSQFLETRKFQRSEIAGLFRVPPHMIGDLERATFSNIEHQGISFVTQTLQPWLVRWEQAIFRDLLSPAERQEIFCEFLVAGLARGDMQSRYAAYAVGRNWGWLSVNDIREMENMNPIPEGDEYLRPLNMVPAGTPAPEKGGSTDGSKAP